MIRQSGSCFSARANLDSPTDSSCEKRRDYTCSRRTRPSVHTFRYLHENGIQSSRPMRCELFNNIAGYSQPDLEGVSTTLRRLFAWKQINEVVR